MGILDRLGLRAADAAPPPTRPRGGSGRNHYGGFLELEEENFELRFPHGLRITDRMYRTDPDVRRAVRMIVNLIAGGTWSVDPFGGEEAEEEDIKAAEAFEWALFEFMSPDFPGHLAEGLPVLVRSGFAPFEGVWAHTTHDGRDLIAPSSLELRLPRTIQRFEMDDMNQLQTLVQFLPMSGYVDLPVEDLVYYRIGAEGDNWEGGSMLRAAYKPWFLKDKLERIDVIKNERLAMGIPIAYPPKDVTPEQLDEVEKILGGIRAAEAGFIIAPGPHAQDLKKTLEGQGWRFEILGIGSGEATVDVRPSIEMQGDKISGAFIEDFMRLGQGQAASGARATADSQENPFLASAEALAGEVESPLKPLAKRFAELNFNGDRPPKVKMSLVDSTSLAELSEFVAKLVEKEVIHPDDELEDFLRRRGDLPPADAEERDARKQQAEEARELQKKAAEAPPVPHDPAAPVPPGPRPPAPAPAPGPAPKPEPAKPEPTKPKDPKADDASERREMRWWEELMSLDEIETAIDSARGRFESAGGEDSRRLAAEMADAALAGKTVTPKADDQLAAAIYNELARLYRTGRSTVVDELNAQRPGAGDAAASAGDGDSAAARRLRERAKLSAQAIANRIWQKVSHAVLGKPSDRAAAQKAGEAEAAAALRGEAQLHAAGALNEGRTDQASISKDEIEGSRYTSILDRRRCDRCAASDDDVLRRLDDPVRLSHIPPNPDCEGGRKCRCMEFFELKDEAPGYGGGPQPAEPSLSPPEGPGGIAADHFDVEGGTAQMKALVSDQLAAIDQVHRIPKSVGRVPIKIKPTLDSGKGGRLGYWNGSIDLEGNWYDEEIALSAQALRRKPAMTSAVHEVAHSLDGHGFGDGTPVAAISTSGGRDLFSSTPAMIEWREAVTNSAAYRGLVAEGTDYQREIRELLARSYEQYIALRSGNEILKAKIAARLEAEPNIYWSESDFAPIAEAFDRFLTTRGLR